jgi:hypothetical protein
MTRRPGLSKRENVVLEAIAYCGDGAYFDVIREMAMEKLFWPLSKKRLRIILDRLERINLITSHYDTLYLGVRYKLAPEGWKRILPNTGM